MLALDATEAAGPPVRHEEPLDRRHSGRVGSSGSAVLFAGLLVTRGRITDLALGSVRVVVDPIAVILLCSGTHVRIDLRTDGVGGWLHLLGRVGRVDVRASAIAIELYVAPPEFEDLVQDQLLAAIECARIPRVVLVDTNRRRRDQVAEAFRVTGCHVIEASSSLEVISALGESQLHPWAVVIADTDVDPRADELRGFLGEAYPGVPLIVIGERGCARSVARLSVDRIPDLALQVYNLVRMRAPVVEA
jgi:hypothetical protein